MAQIEDAAAGVPAGRAKSSGVRGMLEDIREFRRLSKLHGGLVPVSVVATVLGVSRQRVHNCSWTAP